MSQLYHFGYTDFFYTTIAAQRTLAISYGYQDRGISYYVDDGQVRDVGTAFWQRFYKGAPQLEHFYTWTQADINLVLSYGWAPEGSEGVIKTAPGYPGTTALYRYNKFNTANSDLQHYYTTNWMDSLQPWMAGWGSDGIVAYVWDRATALGLCRAVHEPELSGGHGDRLAVPGVGDNAQRRPQDVESGRSAVPEADHRYPLLVRAGPAQLGR
jgi:hypothetical protein